VHLGDSLVFTIGRDALPDAPPRRYGDDSNPQRRSPGAMRSLPKFLLAAMLALMPVGGAAAAPSVGGEDEIAVYNAAVDDAEQHNRAALVAIDARDRERARAELTALRDAFGRLVERFGKTRLGAIKGDPDGVTIMVDVPMRIVTAQMMIDFGRPAVATSSLVAVCRLLASLHMPSAVDAAAACERD
jgi:hypothetical protein